MSIQVRPADFSLRRLSLPAAEPLSLNEAKAHLRIPLDITEFDDLVDGLIAAARTYLEENNNILLVKQDVELILQCFPVEDRIRIPIWPAQAVNYIRWRAADNTTGEMSADIDYDVRIFRKPAEIVLRFAKIWPPIVLATADPVSIGLTIGFLSGDSPELLPMPATVKQSMKLLVDHWYRNGSDVTIGSLMVSAKLARGVDSLMKNVRLD